MELSDPTIPETVQPYHAGYGTPRTDRRRIAQLIRVIRRCAKENLRRVLEQYCTSGAEPRRAAVVGTSTADPSRITNPHIRIHALEGRLFREVIEHALVAAGLQPTFLLEQQLFAETATLLGLTPEMLRDRLKGLARKDLGPWRVEQKSAALGAWLLLSRPPSQH